MKGTIVYDLDGTLETPYLEKPEDVEAVRKFVVAKYGAAMAALKGPRYSFGKSHA